MICANYSNIQLKRTTVMYMIDQLSTNPELATFALLMSGKPPNTIIAFNNHIRQVLLMQHKVLPTLSTHHKIMQQQQPAQNVMPHTTKYKTVPYSPREYTRPARNQTRFFPKPTGWTGAWCTWHGSVTHNSQECYSHKQNYKPKHQANVAHAHTQNEPEQHINLDDIQTRLAQLKATIEPPNEDHDSNGKPFILDSGVTPTYVERPSPQMKQTTNHFTQTANGTVRRITHYRQISIPTASKNILLRAVHTSHIRQNLIGVHELTKYGDVTFKPRNATLHKNPPHYRNPS